MILTFKRLFFLIGIALAALAFLATGAELAAFSVDPDLGLLPGLDRVWFTLSPDTFETARAQWPGLMLYAMALPGWMVLGAPGLALIITCHESADETSPELEESLMLFDELAKRARDDGFSDGSDDRAPSEFPDFQPADARYASDDVADDLIGAHDFLLDGPPGGARPRPDGEPFDDKPTDDKPADDKPADDKS